MEQRAVLINRGRPQEHIFLYSGNAVYTTKYSLLTFLPKFLFEQFSRYANLFFLGVACLQQVPGLSPVSRYGTTVPLLIIIIGTGIKELSEDLRRRMADDQANNAVCQVYDKDKDEFKQAKWKDIRVGDIVRVTNGQDFPADLVLLQSSLDDGECYIETANVDGESSLKTRKSPISPDKNFTLQQDHGIIKCSKPNNKVYEFSGVLLFGENEVPLGPKNLLLRGAKLENTPWIIGAAVYTGRDSKIVMNSSVTGIKRSSIERMTNRQILQLFGVLFFVVTVCTITFYLVTRFHASKFPYLMAEYELTPYRLFIKFFSFVVLMNNLVPISLIMTMEIIRVRLGAMIDDDADMYCPETDTPAVAKTTSLVEELGQVSYIFSDKTGTLTRNEMVMKKIFVGGKTINDFSSLDPDHLQIEKLDLLLHMMATCNAVMVRDAPDGSVSYQSSSPDEVAIVHAASGLGCSLKERKASNVTVEARGEKLVKYSILAVLDFDSTRKRMSIVVKDHDGEIWMYTKGADAVIFPLIQEKQDKDMDVQAQEAVADMALAGLRTLVFAYRRLSQDDFDEWVPHWKGAQNEQRALYHAMEMIERDLIFAGVSGVEDRLQETVPETINTLHRANIKLWVLTGDKLETAVNIGYSCRLLDSSTSLFECRTPEEVSACLNDCEATITDFKGEGVMNMAVILEAKALEVILQDNLLQDRFVKLCRRCKTVICCRVSPLQKAQVVRLVQDREKAVCLAIGDGANDVSMIQEARIGIGISGKEGLQAARSADFSISQFRFLVKLLLVHGAWGYHRISKAAVFCVYKNILLYASQIWFAFVSLFSGQTVFESWMISLYNVLFTAWPPIIIGLTEQFVTAPYLLAHPSLYRLGQRNSFYNYRTFWQSAIDGFWTSLMAFLVGTMIMSSGVTLPDGKQVGLFFMGTTIFAGIVLTVSLKAALLSKYNLYSAILVLTTAHSYWTLIFLLALASCPIAWGGYMVLYDWTSSHVFASLIELRGMSSTLFSSAIFWFVVGLIPMACLLRDFIWKFYKRQFKPREYHIVQEIQHQVKHTLSASGDTPPAPACPV